ADDHVGFQDERPRDADALPLAAGELVRVAGERILREADLGEDVLDPLPPLLLVRPDPVRGHALAEDRLDVLPRVQAAERVLEDHLEPPAEPAHLLLRQLRQIGPVEDHLTVGDVDQPQDATAEGRLAAAGLADEAVGLTGLDLQGDAVDGIDVADRPVEEHALPDGEVDLHVREFEQAHAETSAWDVGRTGLTQRTWCPAARGSVSSGVPVRHSMVYRSQRGAKAQPS